MDITPRVPTDWLSAFSAVHLIAFGKERTLLDYALDKRLKLPAPDDEPYPLKDRGWDALRSHADQKGVLIGSRLSEMAAVLSERCREGLPSHGRPTLATGDLGEQQAIPATAYLGAQLDIRTGTLRRGREALYAELFFHRSGLVAILKEAKPTKAKAGGAVTPEPGPASPPSPAGVPIRRITTEQMRASPDMLIEWGDLKLIIPLSRTTWWRRIRDGQAPSSRPISDGRVGWRAGDIITWLESRRQGSPPPRQRRRGTT